MELEAINEKQSTEKHVGSLQLELVVWAPDYDSTSSVWISDAAESDFHPDNIDSRESENPSLEASRSFSSFVWLAVKEFHLAESAVSWLYYFVELLIPFLVDANQVNYLKLNSSLSDYYFCLKSYAIA